LTKQKLDNSNLRINKAKTKYLGWSDFKRSLRDQESDRKKARQRIEESIFKNMKKIYKKHY